MLGIREKVCPYIMRRWLIAAQYDTAAAVKMYTQSQFWRKYKGLDFLLDWNPPEVLRKFYPGGLSGWDRSGCPVWIIPFGRADLKGLLSSVSKQDFIDYTLRIVETSLALMRESSRKHGAPVYQHTFIFDMSGFTFKDATHTPTLEVVQQLITIYEGNYPETLKAAYVINTPKVFQLVFSILQKTVNQRTLQKIKVFGYDNWKQELLLHISPENLPELWGGKKSLPLQVDVHEYEEGEVRLSVAGICMGGEVPLYYRTIHKCEDIQGMNSVNKQQIDPGTLFSVKLSFRRNCTLNWKFRVEGGDIAFSVYRRRGHTKCSSKLQSIDANRSPKENKTGEVCEEKVPEICITYPGADLSKQVSCKISNHEKVPVDIDTTEENVYDIKIENTNKADNVEREKNKDSKHMINGNKVDSDSEIKTFKNDSEERTEGSIGGGSGEDDRCSNISTAPTNNTRDTVGERQNDATNEQYDQVSEEEEDQLVEDECAPNEEVLQPTKYKSSKECSGGYLRCEAGHVYTIVFDNSESMFRSRKLHYNLNIDAEPKKSEAIKKTPVKEEVVSALDMSDLMVFVRELLEFEEKSKKKEASQSSEPSQSEQETTNMDKMFALEHLQKFSADDTS